jgi:hypothetical protein
MSRDSLLLLLHLALSTRDGRIQSTRASLFFSFFFSTNSGINLGQPVEKGWKKKKKTLVLTWSARWKKGGRKKKKKKKTVVLTLGSPSEKDEKKKHTGINPGQPAGKGRKKKKHPNFRTSVSDLGYRTSVSGPGRTDIVN